jgi:DNA-binding NtrC family response regulator
MMQILAMIQQVAFSDVPVLITGEHGTGKEIIARLVHEKSGRTGEFVAVNAGALPDGTFESELFGHVRGAFTDAKTDRIGAFGRAAGGTLFLDEIANMPAPQQAKLLRVIQESSYQRLGASAPQPSTARLVSATNANLQAMVQASSFRPDLLYRLNVIHLDLPPLRQRREEIVELADQFLERSAQRYGLVKPALEAPVRELLLAHDWPGNVRELEHCMQRALLLSANAGELTAAHLGLPSQPQSGAGARAEETPAPGAPPPEGATLREVERAAFERALKRFPQDRRAAAESLGLSRSAFYRRLTQYGIRLTR